MAAAGRVLQEEGSCSTYQMFPRQQAGWGLPTDPGGPEVTAEEVWGQVPGFPGTGGEEVESVHGVGSSIILSLRR